MKDQQLEEALERVVDEQTFVDFLSQLSRDWSAEDSARRDETSIVDDTGEWKNGSIGTFLEAASEWATASKSGLKFYAVPENPWRRMADILLMGKMYE